MTFLQPMMMMTTPSRSKLDRFIRRTAALIQRCWPNTINDTDDLIQEGHLAALEAEAIRDKGGGPFLRYAFVVVRRAMRRAAARATGIATTSRLDRARALRVQRLRLLGMGDDQIAAQMGLSREALDALEHVFQRAKPLEPDTGVLGTGAPDTGVPDAVCIEREPYGVLNDVLSCAALDDRERALIRLFAEHAFGEVARMTGIPTSTLWRKRQVIRRKLIQSGYGL